MLDIFSIYMRGTHFQKAACHHALVRVIIFGFLSRFFSFLRADFHPDFVSPCKQKMVCFLLHKDIVHCRLQYTKILLTITTQNMFLVTKGEGINGVKMSYKQLQHSGCTVNCIFVIPFHLNIYIIFMCYNYKIVINSFFCLFLHKQIKSLASYFHRNASILWWQQTTDATTLLICILVNHP